MRFFPSDGDTGNGNGWYRTSRGAGTPEAMGELGEIETGENVRLVYSGPDGNSTFFLYCTVLPENDGGTAMIRIRNSIPGREEGAEIPVPQTFAGYRLDAVETRE